jgi:hypothetical protein
MASPTRGTTTGPTAEDTVKRENARRNAQNKEKENKNALAKKKEKIGNALGNLKDEYHTHTILKENLKTDKAIYDTLLFSFPPNGPQLDSASASERAFAQDFVAAAYRIAGYNRDIPKSEAKLITLGKAYISAYTSVYNNGAYAKELAKYKKYPALQALGSSVSVSNKKNVSSVTGSGTSSNSGSSTTTSTTTTADTTPPTYKFNAPMVKESYFSTQSLVASTVDNNAFFDPKVTDGLSAWTKGNLGKGMLQMSRDAVIPESSNYDSTSTNEFDLPLKYGFRFLYNPTDITMQWNSDLSVSPQFLQSGAKIMGGLGPSVLSAGINFDLYLNRISDFSYLNEYGLKVLNPEDRSWQDMSEIVNKLVQDSNLGTKYQIKGPKTVNNPYPINVPEEDLIEIYNKGTMYDLDYLFLTQGLGKYKTSLNGTSADRGWLSGVSTELHLGSGLRYKVRLNGITVKHIIFNERMVPMFSIVSLSLARYYDSASMVVTGNDNPSGPVSKKYPGVTQRQLLGYYN